MLLLPSPGDHGVDPTLEDPSAAGVAAQTLTATSNWVGGALISAASWTTGATKSATATCPSLGANVNARSCLCRLYSLPATATGVAAVALRGFAVTGLPSTGTANTFIGGWTHPLAENNMQCTCTWVNLGNNITAGATGSLRAFAHCYA